MTIRMARTMRTLRATPALILGSLSAACGGGGDGGGLQSTVRDSAGVTIVENQRPPLDSRLGWRVGLEATVSIGTAEGDPAYELFRVGGAMRLSDGRIVVANAGTGELRVYDANGVHLASWGGQGDGPGEFGAMAPSGLEPWPGDSLMARDPFSGRISIFSTDGTFGRALRPEGGYRSVVGPLTDGSVFAATLTTFERGEPGTSEIIRPDVEYGILQADGSVQRDLGAYRGSELYMVNTVDGSPFPRPYPFPRSSFQFTWGDLVVMTTNDEYEIRAYRPDGPLARIVRLDHEVRAPTRGDLRDAVARQNPDRPEALDAVGDMPLVEAFPAFASVRVDRLGYLWVREYRLPGEQHRLWTVFDPEGRVLGLVEMPGSFSVEEIGEDYILGSRDDELDVEYVESWPLDRSGS
ncbi:hypothetical protein [Candidatus Palauibacter polyketidifaciens]|uniref:hypothetical protein n=1 Tax=Candidatus Palauibacter polyketidifaciens TaxID=3056740 RepID=UPI00239B9E8F|nr:hypothetical protein [Candidatus Palauibacter polyketidifaciens]MDE2720243.1 hypothetical protein [Candidatus Palauibacter polyketidifaciens]